MKAIGWLKLLTLFDRKLLYIVTVLVALSFTLLLYRTDGARVVASVNDKIVFVAPLDQDRQVELAGPLGITVLHIENGAVGVISSPCPRKICISMGKASHAGDLIACVPNQLVVRIEGASEEESEYDFIRR